MDNSALQQVACMCHANNVLRWPHDDSYSTANSSAFVMQATKCDALKVTVALQQMICKCLANISLQRPKVSDSRVLMVCMYLANNVL